MGATCCRDQSTNSLNQSLLEDNPSEESDDNIEIPTTSSVDKDERLLTTKAIKKSKQIYRPKQKYSDNLPSDIEDVNVSWRLPKYGTSETELVSSGYLRKISMNLFIIPTDITKLCAYFMDYAFDSDIIDKIKNCASQDVFDSAIFEHGTCKFQFRFRPKSNDPKSRLYILCIDGQDSGNLQRITMDMSIALMGKFVEFNMSWNFAKNSEYLAVYQKDKNWILNYEIDDIKSLDLFAVELRMSVSEDEQKQTQNLETVIVGENVSQSPNTERYEWYISDEAMEKMQFFESKNVMKSQIFTLFKHKFQIWIYPKCAYLPDSHRGAADIIIYSLSSALPSNLKSVSLYASIALNYDILLPCNKFEVCHKSEYNQTFKVCHKLVDPDSILDSDENSGQNPVITVSMTLLHVKDKNGDYIDIDNCTELNNNHIIYTPSLVNYEWDIHDFKYGSPDLEEAELIRKKLYRSVPFDINGFKFYLQLQRTMGTSILYLHLMGLPLNISSILFVYGTQRKGSGDRMRGDIKRILRSERSDFQAICQDLRSYYCDSEMTFQLDIHIIEVRDTAGNCISYNNNDEKEQKGEAIAIAEPQGYKWKLSWKHINIATKTEHVFMCDPFTLFGIRWYIKCIPFAEYWKPHKWSKARYDIKCGICVGVADVPLNVTEITVSCRINVYGDTGDIYTFQLNHDTSYCRYNIFKIERKQMYYQKGATIDLQLTLLSVYDKDGTDILKEYLVYDNDEQEEKDDEAVEIINDWDNASELKAYLIKDECDESHWIYRSDNYIFEDDGEEVEMTFELMENIDPLKQHQIHVCFNSLPNEIQKLSMKCNVKIEDIDMEIAGFVHFEQNKLRALLVDGVRFFGLTKDELTLRVNIEVIAAYDD